MTLKRKNIPQPPFGVPTPYNSGKGTFSPHVRPACRSDIATARIVEIYEDNLICELYDTEYHRYILEIPVAVPVELRQTPVNQNVFSDHVRTYAYSSVTERTVYYTTTGNSTPYLTREETLEPPYYVGELIQVSRSCSAHGLNVENQTTTDGYAVDGISVTTREAKPSEDLDPMTAMPRVGQDPYLIWEDINAAGRRWTKQVGNSAHGALGGVALIANPHTSAGTLHFSDELGTAVNATVTTGASANIEVDVDGDYLVHFATRMLSSTVVGAQDYDKTGGGSGGVDVVASATFLLQKNGGVVADGNYGYKTQSQLLVIDSVADEKSVSFVAPIALEAGDNVSIYVAISYGSVQINDASFVVELQK